VGGDEEGFSRMFAETREYFGEFTSEALELSSYLIDRLVERA
jgi:chorismate mutase/prephenate dehydrogenase